MNLKIRKLTTEHAEQLSQLLLSEPEYNLFILHNMKQYGFVNPQVSFWGAFDAGYTLCSVLMIVEKRCALYAQNPGYLDPLISFAEQIPVSFCMGKKEIVDYILKYSHILKVRQLEEHNFCLIEHINDLRLPDLAVRKASEQDLDKLTRFYLGTDGFEEMPEYQVRYAMQNRVTALRTYVLELDSQIVSAASTSAETEYQAMIGGVWTACEKRNCGYSTAVVYNLTKDLLAEGKAPYLFYLQNNFAAGKVYEKIGYKITGSWTVTFFEGNN